MSQPIRVVTVDDHKVIRTGVRTMLEDGGEEFTLVGEAADGKAALRVIGDLQPDVVLMDLRMPGMDGIEAIEHIHQRWPQIAVVILTTYNEDALMIRGLQAGACGYVLKDADLEVLLNAIRAAARGERLVQPELVERLLLHAARATQLPSEPSPARPAEKPRGKGRVALTEREREVLMGVARGERSKEIAKRLGITERTVGAYITSIYNKLDVDSRAAAVAVALERGLLPGQE
ncbi:MAG TPA: response regulator transcription factor [Ktedonobacteraceae bacterium]|nr:response regulator transcription factor [Ktedonobacteraceae bacterium]